LHIAVLVLGLVFEVSKKWNTKVQNKSHSEGIGKEQQVIVSSIPWWGCSNYEPVTDMSLMSIMQ
jgi:hypothetical protein